MRPAVVAHRGAAQQAPENSLAAFNDARRQGADGVELDVRRTADGALVLSHDPGIAGVGLVSELALAELPGSIATLREAMDVCAGMLVNVEIKNDPNEAGHDPTDALCAQVLAEIAASGQSDDVIVSSFDLDTVVTVRRLAPRMAVGLLVDPVADPFVALETVVTEGLSAMHPFVLSVTEPLVVECHARGVALNVWTVNGPGDLELMRDLGVDAVITDDVPLALGIIDA